MEQLQARRVERLESLGHVLEPQVPRAVVSEFLEHLGLLGQVALLGVVGIHAECEEWVGSGGGRCGRRLGDRLGDHHQ